MNYAMIRFVLARTFQLMAVLLLLPLLVALVYAEYNRMLIFAGLSAFFFVVGYLGAFKKPENRLFFAREGFLMTALIWITISLLGALPFRISGEIPHYVDAVFETVSGFTTTGASILSDVEVLSKSTMFWRCFTHWIGGMGVLVFMLAILPLAGGSTMHLMRAESPGPSVGKFLPRVRGTARVLYLIYISFTVTEIVLLLITGLNLYEASTLTFSTVGTGGFSITNDGINPYPLASQIVIIVFMIICGINFSVYYFFVTKKPKEALKSEEMRWYLVILFGVATMIAIMLYRANITATPGESFHHALFASSSIMTTTGFATLDFNLWPQLSRTLLFMLTLLGACAGSTGGGFKVSRLIICVRRIKNELIFSTHRKSVRQVYMDGHRVESTTVKSVMTYVSIYAFIYVLSFVLISVDGFDFETNCTAVAATLNNVGPGLGMVGATGNYGAYSVFSKIILSLDMLAGRLELIPLMILFRPKSWRGD
ncbi:MAG: TrkH family potassium uptake protein [Lachnospiraceae bacterium]|nr:TrkH family potassium uptake protein [Lachnospiraceae bacterium]